MAGKLVDECKASALRLPNHFEDFISRFSTLDRCIIFLNQRRIPTTPERIAAIYKSLCGSQTEDESVLEMLRTIAGLGLGQLKYVYFDETLTAGASRAEKDCSDSDVYVMEFSFTKFLGAGTRMQGKRLEYLRQQLSRFLEQEQKRASDSGGSCDSKSVLLPLVALPAKPQAAGSELDEFVANVTRAKQLRQKQQLFLAQSEHLSQSGLKSSSLLSSPILSPPLNSERTHKLADTLEGLKELPSYVDQIVHVERLEAHEATFATLDVSLPSEVDQALEKKGIRQLYQHQVLGVAAALKGHHVTISTSTSSGKSLSFYIPVFTSMVEDAKATAIFIFPTKALAQDQLRSLHEFCSGPLSGTIFASTLDGDTSHIERGDILKKSNIILTNPDMLHVTLLPNHKLWKRVFINLKYVVIDEAHTYRGVFGSHVSCVLRRLMRLCAVYGSAPQFVCCSATISNPSEHFQQLIPAVIDCVSLDKMPEAVEHREQKAVLSTGVMKPRSLVVITKDTSPRGEKLFVLWNPPLRADLETPFQEKEMSNHEAIMSLHASPDPSLRGLKLPSALDGSSRSAPLAFNSVEESQVALSSPDVIKPIAKPHNRRKRKRPRMLYSHHGKALNEEQEEEVLEPSPPPALELNKQAKEQENGEYRYTRLVKRGDSEVRLPPPRRRVSIFIETALLLTTFVKLNLRTIAFCKSRKCSELVLAYAVEHLKRSAPKLVPLVKGYRGGYTKEDRREIEKGLFGGELMAVTATCALELGVDVGSLDATIQLGYPGSISSMWQQAGRSGRGTKDSLSVMVLFDSPIDQLFVSDPQLLFGKSPEAAIVDPFNAHILRTHLLCAAAESPLYCNSDEELKEIDRWLFGSSDRKASHDGAVDLSIVEELYMQGKLMRAGRRDDPESGWTTHPVVQRPALSSSLRVIDPVTFKVVDEATDSVIDNVGYSRAFFCLFQGAIILHQGSQYLVRKLDLADHVAYARKTAVHYFTSCQDITDVNIIKNLESVPKNVGFLQLGMAQVVTRVYGYHKIWKRSMRIFETCSVTLPPLEYSTSAFWVNLDRSWKEEVDSMQLDFFAGVHAINHALASLLPLVVLCEKQDIDTPHLSPLRRKDGLLKVLLYDTSPGGIGICEQAFKNCWELLELVIQTIQSCSCEFGCLRCVHDATCPEYNYAIDKQAALVILNNLEVSMKKYRAQEREDTFVEHQTPTKVRNRQLNLLRAKRMDAAKSRSFSIQRSWLPSLPNYPEECSVHPVEPNVNLR